jgi:hypothetical protein
MSALSPSDVVDALDADATTEKRASWEGFEFTVLGGDEIEVVNSSYENPDEHTYTVHVEGGIPSDCNCPAFEYQDGACKHMVGVAIREPVLEAVTAEPTVKTDGGVTVEKEEATHSDERPDDCDCWNPKQGLPCWPCYRDGFEEPNQTAEWKDK